MKFYPSTILYSRVITLSICIVIRRNNFFFSWIGLEISLFGFLPLLTVSRSTADSFIKYFLIQAAGSAIFIVSILIKTPPLLYSSITIKLGIFPFFQWLPSVITSLSWSSCLLLVTLQKLNPIIIVTQINRNLFLIFVSIFSIITGALFGFNQTIIRALISYSSITHTGWMLLSAILNLNLLIIYVIFYFLITATLFLSFKNRKTEKTYNNKDPLQAFIVIVLVGIPPFSIFFIKISIIMLLANSPLIVIMLLLRTFISRFYYLSFSIPTLLTHWNNKPTPLIFIIINLFPLTIII